MSLPTTAIGSFPKPASVRRARWQHAEGAIDDEALRRVEDEATAEWLRFQESAGLDVLVDGQMDRSDLVGFFGERLGGLEPGGWVRCFDNRYYRRPRITGPIARKGPLVVERWKGWQKRTGRPLKAVVTGPYTLMHWCFDEHYRSREACCLAFAGALRAEIEDLVGAGAEEIQIDEPAISSRPDEMALAGEAVGRLTADLSGKVRTWLHVCYGDLGPVLGPLLSLPVDGLLLELANSRFAALDGLAGARLVAAGVVDVLSPDVESVDEIRARIERVLDVVPAERLWIAPDAGMRALTGEQARAKISAMVEAASSLG